MHRGGRAKHLAAPWYRHDRGSNQAIADALAMLATGGVTRCMSNAHSASRNW
jgi:hypothetical protein